jgi:hypothetical protein
MEKDEKSVKEKLFRMLKSRKIALLRSDLFSPPSFNILSNSLYATHDFELEQKLKDYNKEIYLIGVMLTMRKGRFSLCFVAFFLLFLLIQAKSIQN